MTLSGQSRVAPIGGILAWRVLPTLQCAQKFPLRISCIGTASYDGIDEADGFDRIVELYSVDPVSRMKLGLFFLSPKARSLPSALKPVLATLSPEMARGLLIHLYRVSARHFQKVLHQKNVLRGAATHLADHFGPDVIPAQLQELFPPDHAVLRLGGRWDIASRHYRDSELKDGAGGRTRTDISVRTVDFESTASTNSATPAHCHRSYSRPRLLTGS